jgi:DNA-binding transcriptional MerR regulator
VWKGHVENLRVSTVSSVISPVEDPSAELGPTIDVLVDAARAAGRKEASRRTVRSWVSQGLISAPRRRGRAWLYPVAAIGQVDTVVHWRRRGADLEQIRFAVFIETGTGSAQAALTLARRFAESWEQAVVAISAQLQENPDALHEEAAKAARMRGRAPLPNRVRGVSLDQRTLATAFVIGRMLDLPAGADDAAAALHSLERILGMRSGRGGKERDLSAVTLQPDDWPNDPAELRAALSRATPERVEFARRGVEFAVAWVPALRGTLATAFGVEFTPLADILQEWVEKLTPHVYALMFAVFIRNGLERASDDQITGALAVFSAPVITATLLADRPPQERTVVVRRLRPYQQLQLERTTVPNTGETAG